MYFDGTIDFPLPGDIIADFGNGPNAMRTTVSPQYADKYLPSPLSGELASCFALTGPDAGPNVRMPRVPGGSSEIQSRTIACRLIRGDVEL